MRHTTLIFAAFALAGCVTTPESEYDRHAPEIMAFVASETGKPAAPIPAPVFTPQLSDNAALYDLDHNVILLQDDWQPNLEGLGSLAHEFTHAIQAHNFPEILKRHRRWNAAMKAGNLEKAPEWLEKALANCLEWEVQAYQVEYAFKRSIKPDYWADKLGPITIKEASTVHAHGSCEPLKVSLKMVKR